MGYSPRGGKEPETTEDTHPSRQPAVIHGGILLGAL